MTRSPPEGIVLIAEQLFGSIVLFTEKFMPRSPVRLIRRNSIISNPQDRALLQLTKGTSFGVPTHLQAFVPDMVCPEVTVLYPEVVILGQSEPKKGKKDRIRSAA